MSAPPTGRRAILREGAAALARAGIEGAAAEARFLLCDAEGIVPGEIALAPEAPVRNADLYRGWIARRATGVPSSRITGFRNFRGLEFAVDAATLDPRQDSEALVDAVLAMLPDDRPSRIIDIGTGTGCLILSVLAERPRAYGIGVDLSPGAARAARRNALRLGLDGRFQAVVGDLLNAFGAGTADIVLSNPPYIRSDEMAALDPAVRDFDPPLALDGGPDGLACYRRLLAQAMGALRPGGCCAVEIGWDQGPPVHAMMAAQGFADTRIICDLADRDRVVTGRKKDLD